MERISIFNYEAFYLDFLEGNLSEEDTVLFFEFLKANPHLEVDLEDMPSIDTSANTLDSAFLKGLKQVDFVSDKISLNNIESFMIASVEGQLDASKEKELMFMLSQNSELLKDHEQLKKLKLEPDTSIVFADKASLKQSRKLILWPYVAAAASILLFLFIYQGFISETTSSPNVTASTDPKVKKQNSVIKKTIILPKNGDSKSIEKDRVNDLTKKNNLDFVQKNESQTDLVATILKDNKNNIPNKKDSRVEFEIARMEKKEIQLATSKNPEFIEVATNENNVVTAQTNYGNTAYNSMKGMNDMKNPIKPITNRLSELTRTEINLLTSQKNDNERKGFYLKIGKFEIERKGH